MRRLHGEMSLEPYDHPNLIIWTERPGSTRSRDPILDEIDRELDWCNVTLSMVISSATVVGFSVIESVESNGERVVRRAQSHDPWRAQGSSLAPARTVDVAMWSRLSARVIPTLRVWNGEYEQTTHAIRSFFRACQMNQLLDDRYELFCRSIETVLQTERGKGADQFIEGVVCVLGVMPEAPSAAALKDHYERRNAIVHGHRFLDPNKGDDERTVSEMENVARSFLQHFLSDDTTFDSVLKLQRHRAEERSAPRKTGQGPPTGLNRSPVDPSNC